MSRIIKTGSRQEYTLQGADLTPGRAQPWSSIIGGRDEATGGRFVPNLNLSRWDGEAWLNINHRDTFIDTEAPRLTKDGLSVKKGGLRHLWYERAGLDGATELEWELVWEANPNPPPYLSPLQKPPWYRVVFDLAFPKGLRFCRQPNKANRPGETIPDRVKDSYAVYWSSNNGVYKTGKLCHIYRPEVMDANGKRTWCGFQVDETQRTMTVLINQAWLNHAAYPVTLDPTYGYTSAGATNFESDYQDLMLTEPTATMPTAGVTVSSSMYTALASWSDPITVTLAVYEAGVGGALVDFGTVLLSSTTPAWKTAAFAGAALNYGALYSYAGWSGNVEGGWRYYYDTGISGPHFEYSNVVTSLPATVPATQDWWGEDRMHSQYVTYSTGWNAGNINKVPNQYVGSINKVPRAGIGSVNRLA